MSLLPQFVSACVAAGTLGSLIADHGLLRKTSAWLDRSVHRGPGQRRSVAITFDDGPSQGTPALLAYLRQEKVRATFFQLGMHVQQFPAIARQVSAEGHEIGNHGWSHVSLRPQRRPALHFPTPGLMYRELTETQQVLTQVHGEPTHLFRPPFGFGWIGLAAMQRRLGLRAVQWTVLGHDWEWSAQKIANHLLARTVPGAILCLHDGRDTAKDPDITATIDALRLLIPELRTQGYSFETVSELLRPDAVAARVLPKAPALARSAIARGQSRAYPRNV